MTQNAAYMSSTLRTCQDSQRSAPSPRLALADLHGDDHDEGVAEPEPQPGEDERHRAGQQDRGEERAPAGPVVRRRLEHGPVDLLDAGHGGKATRKNEVMALVATSAASAGPSTKENSGRKSTLGIG